MFKFRYEPKFEDYLLLNRHVLWSNVLPHLKLPLILFLGIAALTFSLPFVNRALGHTEPIKISYTVLYIFLIIPVMLAAAWKAVDKGARTRWDSAEELRMTRDYEISDEGIRMTGASVSGAMEWRHITQAELANGFVILKTAQNQFYYFPIAAVQNFDAFLNLVAKHVKTTKNWNASR